MMDFRNLKVWRKAHELVLLVYKATANYPPDERFGLTLHTRKSATSSPSNIAEGCGRSSRAELRRFMEIAAGSTSELEYQLLLAFDLRYLTGETYDDLQSRVVEVKKILATYIGKVD